MRLTKKELKEKFVFYPLYCGNIGWVANEGTDKLGKLEDIEEELGIDLITLVKALKNGIYGSMYGGKPNNKYNSVIFIEPRSFKLCLHIDEPCIYYEWGWPGPEANRYKLKDYGISWALTTEELE